MLPIVTIILALNLIIISAASYFMSTHFSPTLFIPAAFGVVIILASLVAIRKPGIRKHSMHVAMLVALIGFLAAAVRLPKSWAKFNSAPDISPMAFYSQLSMASLCLLIVVLGIYSFVKARLNRQAYNQ
jgi:hypothetical protein